MFHLMKYLELMREIKRDQLQYVTGWGQSQVTPEELEEKLDKLETEVERIDKDVTILKNNLNILD